MCEPFVESPWITTLYPAGANHSCAATTVPSLMKAENAEQGTSVIAPQGGFADVCTSLNSPLCNCE